MISNQKDAILKGHHYSRVPIPKGSHVEGSTARKPLSPTFEVRFGTFSASNRPFSPD